MQNLNNLSHVTDKNFNSKRELKGLKRPQIAVFVISCKSKTLRILQSLGFHKFWDFTIIRIFKFYEFADLEFSNFRILRFYDVRIF